MASETLFINVCKLCLVSHVQFLELDRAMQGLFVNNSPDAKSSLTGNNMN